MKHIISV